VLKLARARSGNHLNWAIGNVEASPKDAPHSRLGSRGSTSTPQIHGADKRSRENPAEGGRGSGGHRGKRNGLEQQGPKQTGSEAMAAAGDHLLPEEAMISPQRATAQLVSWAKPAPKMKVREPEQSRPMAGPPGTTRPRSLTQGHGSPGRAFWVLTRTAARPCMTGGSHVPPGLGWNRSPPSRGEHRLRKGPVVGPEALPAAAAQRAPQRYIKD
jgi:hypothetical protein